MKRTFKAFVTILLALVICLSNLTTVVAFAKPKDKEGEPESTYASTNAINCVIEGEKIWEDDNNSEGKRPESVTISLYNGETEIASTTATKDTNWKFSFEVPALDSNGNVIAYTVKEQPVEGYEMTAVVDPVITYKPFTVDMKDDRITPCSSLKISVGSSVVVAFKGNEYTVWTMKELTSTEEAAVISKIASFGNKYVNNSTKFFFINGMGTEGDDMYVELNALQEDGSRHDQVVFENTSVWSWLLFGDYTVASLEVAKASITNTYVPETIEISGTKTWNDDNNRDGVRPESIVINLLADGEKVDSQEVKAGADGNWSWSFENLYKYENGEEIVYTITEDAVEGYTASVKGYNVTNTHNPATTEITIEKIWDDEGDKDGIRPDSITVTLYANGDEYDTAEITAEDGWKTTFTGLYVYENGEEIVYTVDEAAVEGYTTEIKGYTVTNTHNPATTEITVEKIWDDEGDKDGIRPDSITVTLYANGDEYDTAEITAEDGWKTTFTGLYVYEDGEEIVYTIDEAAVEGYTAEIDGYTITNKHIPEDPKAATVVIEGIKYLDRVPDSGFMFNLTDAAGRMIDYAISGNNGRFAFDTITFTEVGTYRYRITEVDGGSESINYDTSVYDVVVTVTENGENLVANVAVSRNGANYRGTIAFYNTTIGGTYIPEEEVPLYDGGNSGGDDGLTEILDEEVPLTGDSFNVIYIPIMIGALAAFGVAAYFLLKKKKAE